MKKWFFSILLLTNLIANEHLIDCVTTEDAKLSKIDLKQFGSVEYEYNGAYLTHIHRKDINGKILYTHQYIYDEQGVLTKEVLIGNTGVITYDRNPFIFTIEGPAYFYQRIRLHKLEAFAKKYIEDPLKDERLKHCSPHSFLKQREQAARFAFDTRGRLRFNDCAGEVFQLVYNKQGMLDGVLADTWETYFNYDNEGRRIAKLYFENEQLTKETYWNFGINDMAVFDHNNELKYMRIPGLTVHKAAMRSIAIETKDDIFAPVHNFQGDIVRLISIKDGRVINTESSHGYTLNFPNPIPMPWAYREKNYDVKTGLVNFGSRYYWPHAGKWITPDPYGYAQSFDLYQYCFNQPDYFMDPDGCFVFAIPLIMGGITMAECLWAAGGLAVAYGCYKGTQWANDHWRNGPSYNPSCPDGRFIGYNPPPYSITAEEQAFTKNYIERNKQGSIDETLPEDIHNDPNWVDVSHPEAKAKGHYEFKNKETGETLNWDRGNPDVEFGHRRYDHFHRPNPDSHLGNLDKYLDGNGNPISNGHDSSHLYRPENAWWCESTNTFIVPSYAPNIDFIPGFDPNIGIIPGYTPSLVYGGNEWS